MSLSHNIAERRRAAGLSQAELAERINVSVHAVQKWETERATPDITNIAALARAFGVTTDALLADTGSAQTPSTPLAGRKRKPRKGILILLLATATVAVAVAVLFAAGVFKKVRSVPQTVSNTAAPAEPAPLSAAAAPSWAERRAAKRAPDVRAALAAGLVTEDVAARGDAPVCGRDLVMMLDALLERELGQERYAIGDILSTPEIAKARVYARYGENLARQSWTYHMPLKTLLDGGHNWHGELNGVEVSAMLIGLDETIAEYARFRDSPAMDEPLSRADASLLLYAAATLLGFEGDHDAPAYIDYGACRWQDYARGHAVADRDAMLEMSALTGTRDSAGSPILDVGFIDENGGCYLAPDAEMPTADAIAAVWRLSDCTPSTLIPVAEVPALEPDADFQAALAACTLPDARYDALPVWHGLNENSMANYFSWSEGMGSLRHIPESAMRCYAEMGFDNLRLLVDYRSFTSFYDAALITMDGIEALDDVIRLGAKYSIHIGLCINQLPGYLVGGGGPEASNMPETPEKQALCIAYYQMLARRYADIPNSVLSFNPYNEPGRADEAFWVNMLKRTFAAIRQESPDRLIITDTYVTRFVFDGLMKESVAQSCHIYDPADLTHSGLGYNVSDTPAYTGPWPMPIVSESVAVGHPLCIKGDFAAGTGLCFTWDYHTANAFSMEAVAADGGVEKQNANLNGVVAGDTVRFTLTRDAVELRFSATGPNGRFCRYRQLGIQRPGGSSVSLYIPFLASRELYHTPPTVGLDVTVNADGSYSSADYLGYDDAAGVSDAWFNAYIDEFMRLRTADTPSDFLIGEFGMAYAAPEEYAAGYLDALLGTLQEARVGWQLYASGGWFGIAYSEYPDTTVLEGLPVSLPRLLVLQKYMSDTPVTVFAADVSVSEQTLTLREGDTAQLTAAISNAGEATNPRVGWYSSNGSIVRVDGGGNLVALRAGTATVYALASDGSGAMAACTVTVN